MRKTWNADLREKSLHEYFKQTFGKTFIENFMWKLPILNLNINTITQLRIIAIFKSTIY